jgi:hypothetical protein
LGSLTSCGSHLGQNNWAGGNTDDREKTGYATESHREVSTLKTYDRRAKAFKQDAGEAFL